MSTILIDNSLDIRWRSKYNEDIDLSLRVLKGGDCTILFNAFLQGKCATQTVTGGNTGQHADGVELFLVEVSDPRDKQNDKPRVVTKRNMNREELSLLIEHHYRNRFRKPRRR